MPSQISNRIEKRKNAVATDRNGSEIRHDDTVREIGGENKQGVIIHIHRSYLFLLNREQTENSGVFVVRASNVATVAAKGGRVAQQASSGPDLTKMNPAVQRNGAPNGSMAPPKSFGRDRVIGQTVKIRKGPHKGLLGIVKDTTDTDARVELHTKNKVVSIPKDILGIQDPISGNSVPYSEFSTRGRGGGMRGGYSGGYGSATPRSSHEFSGSRTPIATAANGGRTPAWGSSRTPAWGADRSGGAFGGSSLPSRTPGWGRDSSGGRTPGWSGGDGGRTSYGGAGGVSKSTLLPLKLANLMSSALLLGNQGLVLHMAVRAPFLMGLAAEARHHHMNHLVHQLMLVAVSTTQIRIPGLVPKMRQHQVARPHLHLPTYTQRLLLLRLLLRLQDMALWMLLHLLQVLQRHLVGIQKLLLGEEETMMINLDTMILPVHDVLLIISLLDKEVATHD